MFETDKEVLEWYERQPRALSKEYVNQIRWKDVSNYPLNEAFVPVLFYMRDIEYFTDMYYRELMRTPTGRSYYQKVHGSMERRGVAPREFVKSIP